MSKFECSAVVLGALRRPEAEATPEAWTLAGRAQARLWWEVTRDRTLDRLKLVSTLIFINIAGYKN